MEQNFTPNHLIKYLYKETTASETLAINEALTEDVKLMEEFGGLYAAYKQLPKVTFRPCQSAVQNILKYSQHTALEKQV